MRTEIEIHEAPAMPPAPPRVEAGSPRAAWQRRAVAAACAALLVLAVQQHADIASLRDQLAAANVVIADTDRRLDALAAAETSLAGRVDEAFDPATVVAATEPSVFTLLAGPLQGSAFVLASESGHSLLVTNFHVVRSVWAIGATRVVVRGAHRSFEGTVTTVRPDADLALVRVDTSLPALTTGATQTVTGEQVVVVGSPFGFGGTATTGIVSAVRGRWIQFSAPVSPGSSGGPVLDGAGHVIGVAARKVLGRGAEGLSFAIAIDEVCRLTAAC
jgi:S1-C subfamily serine protease